MKVKLDIEEPGEIQATLKITMSIENWSILSKQLSDQQWPSHKLNLAISKVIRQANQEFTVKDADVLLP